MAQLNDLLILGKSVLIGDLKVNSKIIQGSPSTDSTVLNMNRLQSDLYVSGDGSAPNSPKVAGFYLGKSTSDENRHMDIVSGGDYSYIDFNKASNANDYTTRLITNVSTGLTEFSWGSVSNPLLNINGRFVVNNSNDVSVGSASGAFRIGNINGEHLAMDCNEIMAKTSATTGGTLYLNAEGGTVETSSDGFKIGSAYVRSNNVGSYGNLRIYGGAKSDYNGIHFGDDNTGLTVMSGTGNSAAHQGLYNEAKGRWIIYYNRNADLLSIGNSTARSGYINIGGNIYSEGNIYINNGGHGGIGLYNTTSPNNYGIHMSYTNTYGTYGQVTSDWATYFCFDGDVKRGWIFKNANTNVFSVNGQGTLSIRENVPGIFFRPGHNDYDANISYQTSGNEAMVFTTKKDVTSFMFVNGEDTITNIASDRWTKLTPGLQIKKSCVAIKKLIANGADPSYTLDVGGTARFDDTVTAPSFNGPSSSLSINNTANLSSCLQYIQSSAQTSGNDMPSNTWWHVIKMNHGTGDTYYKRLLAFDFWNDDIYTSGAAGDGKVRTWKRVWVEGNSVTGAVWNDYAEYRESDCEEFGYVLCEKGDDTLTKTTERLSHFAGVSSDTWGFSQGKTERATTPIAVAGRVLVYPYQNRDNYKPGDCVCAAPGGTVDIMTREEVIQYPDRIVGTVSCVPEYDTWGGGEKADRPAVAVNGRIWIKVK